jgi:predicted ATPase
MLGPELVLSRLDERFRLLTGGRRSALPQRQTLRATLDWSYELLPEPVFFAAGFTLEAAVWLGLSSVVECRERIEHTPDCLESDSNVDATLTVQLHVSLGLRC